MIAAVAQQSLQARVAFLEGQLEVAERAANRFVCALVLGIGVFL